MKKLIALSLGFSLLIFPPSYAQEAGKLQPPPLERFVSVSGEAETNVAPDQGVLSLSIVSRDMDLTKAKRDNDQKTEKLVAIAREFKIPTEKIALSGLNINPEYNYNNKKRVFEGYSINRSLRITIDKLDIHEKLLSAVVGADIDQVSGIQFQIANPEAERDKLRAKAVENARARAETLAKAAGVKVGKPIMISTGSAMMPPRPMFKAAMMASAPMEADMSVAPSLPGLIELRESVNVTFELE